MMDDFIYGFLVTFLCLISLVLITTIFGKGGLAIVFFSAIAGAIYSIAKRLKGS